VATTYQVMVQIGLKNGVSPSLLTMSGQFKAVGGNATKLGGQVKQLGNIFATMMLGHAMERWGEKLTHIFKSAITSAAELQRQMIGIQAVTRGSAGEMTRLEAAIMKVTGVTTFSNVQVAQIAKTLATSNKLTVSQITDLVPVFAKFADVQYILKGMSPEKSVVEAVRLAHTAQHYTPEELKKYLDLLTRATMITPGTVTEIGTSLKYSQGVAKTALGISDDQTILLTALLNRLGFAGSRGGTNLVAAMTRSIPGVFGGKKAREALEHMGFVDEAGHSTIFDHGKFSIEKWMSQLSTYLDKEFKTMPEALARQEIMRDYKDAFGVPGMRIASILSNPVAIEQFRSLIEEFHQLPGNEEIQEEFATKSVWQQIINAQTNLKSILTLLGEKTLPEVSSALGFFNRRLGELIEYLGKGGPEVSTQARVIVYSLGVIGGALMLFAKGLMTLAILKYLGGIMGALKVLGGAAGFVASPVMLVVAAIVALAAAAAVLYMKWDKVGPFLKACWDGIAREFKNAGTILLELTESMWKPIIEAFRSAFSRIADNIWTWAGKIKELWNTPVKQGEGSPHAVIDSPREEPHEPGHLGIPGLGSLKSDKSYAGNYVRGGGQTIQVSSKTYLDGRQIAETVTDHQVKESNRALGGGYPDYTFGAPNVGLG
jgi:hypothetical protein